MASHSDNGSQTLPLDVRTESTHQRALVLATAAEISPQDEAIAMEVYMQEIKNNH